MSAAIRAGELGVWNVIGERFVPLATAAQTCGEYEIFDVTAPEGSGPPPHRHAWNEAYLLLEGELEVATGEPLAWSRVSAQSFVSIPGGTLHAYRVVSPTAHFITFTTPAGAAEFFADMNAQIREMPADAPRIPAVAAAHGVEVVLPA